MLCDQCGNNIQEDTSKCEQCETNVSPDLTCSAGQKTAPSTSLHHPPLNIDYSEGEFLCHRFELKGYLGSGRFGSVYKAHDHNLDLEVAVKIIHQHLMSSLMNPELSKWFSRINQLNHPNIVKLYNESIEENLFLYSMQYLEGLTLEKIIILRQEKDEAFALSEIEPIFSQITKALEYVHSTVHHGFLTPKNIIMLPDRIQLMDVGLSLLFPPSKLSESNTSSPRDLIYLAPEVRVGQKADARSDIYSLGIILAEMLTGQTLQQSIDSIRPFNHEISPLLDIVFRRATDVDPSLRYQHVNSFFADLANILEKDELAEEEDIPTLVSETATVWEESETEEIHLNIKEINNLDQNENHNLYQPPLSPPPIPKRVKALPPPFHASSYSELDLPTEDFVHQSPSQYHPSPFYPSGETLLQHPEVTSLPTPLTPPSLPSISTTHHPMAFSSYPSSTHDPRHNFTYSPMQSQNLVYPPPLHIEFQEDSKLSNLWIFSFVLGILLIFGTGGIGLYVKFIYLPNKSRQIKTHQINNFIHKSPLTQEILTPAIPKPPPPILHKKDNTALPSTHAKKPPTGDHPNKKSSDVTKPTNGETNQKKSRRSTQKTPLLPLKKKAIATHQPKKTLCPFGMVYLRQGSVLMGSAPNDEFRSFGEKNLLKHFTKSFCIDRYEYPGKKGMYPKTNVTWSTAQRLCHAQEKRLCSEIEWERACKGNRSRRYPYGNSFNASHCNTRNTQQKNRQIASTGRFRKCRSSFGVYDLSGNVAEWTSSRFRQDKGWRTIRGGSSKRPDWDVRCASRGNYPPSTKKPSLGFRCCSEPKLSKKN